MKMFDLAKLEQYSPGNRDFLIKSVGLLRDELIQFHENLNRYRAENDHKGIHQAIHKIKPSVELFDFPEEYLESLLGVYNWDENFSGKEDRFDELIEKINIFTTNIIEELNTYLKENQ